MFKNLNRNFRHDPVTHLILDCMFSDLRCSHYQNALLLILFRTFIKFCIPFQFYTEHTEIFKILLKKRIDLEHVDDFGHAPLYYALKQPTGVMASLFPARLKQVRHFSMFQFSIILLFLLLTNCFHKENFDVKEVQLT